MLEFFTKLDDNDAMVILRKDHDKVKELFAQFEKAENMRQKKKIVSEVIMELKIHATIEEEIFYPTLRKHNVEKALLNEADEEHHVAKLLVAELEQMDGSEDHYEAKFTVLSENIKHHIKEEEGELFPQARKLEVDFTSLGKQLLQRKQQLIKNGVPPCAEEKMISSHKKGSGDSPAMNAKSQPKKASTKRVVKHLVKKALTAKTAKSKGVMAKNMAAKNIKAPAKAAAKNVRSAKK